MSIPSIPVNHSNAVAHFTHICPRPTKPNQEKKTPIADKGNNQKKGGVYYFYDKSTFAKALASPPTAITAAAAASDNFLLFS